MRELQSSLKQTRLRLGLSQQELAALAGVTRQAIGGLESGQSMPSAAVALRLARALGCRVEDLFWLEEETPEVDAVPAGPVPAGERVRFTVARVGGRWVAHPLMGEDAFRTDLVPADGEGVLRAGAERVRVRLLEDAESLGQSVLLAGCTPAFSLWAQAAERWHPGLRVHWRFANSMAALQMLARGEVHAAGAHLYDPETGEHNAPFVRRLLPGRAAVLVNLGTWEEGMLVPAGNPKGLRTAADLGRPGVRIVNREAGAGSRQLLELALAQAGVPGTAVQGFDREVGDHVAVARAVAAGAADAGVSVATVAAAFGLGFVPLRSVRYDIVVLREAMEEPAVRHLLATLGHRRLRAQLEALGGYDTSATGDVVATVDVGRP